MNLNQLRKMAEAMADSDPKIKELVEDDAVWNHNVNAYIASQKRYAEDQIVEFGSEPVIGCWVSKNKKRIGQAILVPADVVLDMIDTGIVPAFNLRYDHTNKAKVPYKTVRVQGTPKPVDISRWVMDCSNRYTVRHKTGNWLDLRRSQMYLEDNYHYKSERFARREIMRSKQPTGKFTIGNSVVPKACFNPDQPHYPKIEGLNQFWTSED